MEGVVELPVAAAWEAVSGVVGGGDFDGGDAGVAGERCCGREPAGSPGAAEQLGGDDWSDPVDLAEPAPGRCDGLLDLGGQVLQALIGGADLGDQVAGQLLCGPSRRGRPVAPR